MKSPQKEAGTAVQAPLRLTETNDPKWSDDGSDNGQVVCWVARAVYGEDNPDWQLFRQWMLTTAPAWFRSLYIAKGANFATWLHDKPRTRSVIRRWMDRRIKRLRN